MWYLMIMQDTYLVMKHIDLYGPYTVVTCWSWKPFIHAPTATTKLWCFYSLLTKMSFVIQLLLDHKSSFLVLKTSTEARFMEKIRWKDVTFQKFLASVSTSILFWSFHPGLKTLGWFCRHQQSTKKEVKDGLLTFCAKRCYIVKRKKIIGYVNFANDVTFKIL